jgi:hypothetical protein
MFYENEGQNMTIAQCSIESQSFIQTDCCHPKAEHFRFQKTLDSVCRIAIGVFAAIYAPVTFFISLQAGFLAGTGYAVYRLYQNKPMFPDGENKPVCAQGYMDFLSGMKFPPPAGTIATAIFIAAHTRHDPSFYAPFCGLFIGFWLGREGTISGRDLLGHTVDYLFPKKPCCPCKMAMM